MIKLLFGKTVRVFFWCLLSTPLFAQEYMAWNIGSSKEISNGLSFALAVDNNFKGIELDLTKKNPPESISNKPYLLLLYQYMKFAKENNYKRIMPMFSADDGSLAHYQKEVKSDPNKYSRFNIVDKVTIDEIVKWGNYRAVNIRIYGEGRLLTPFTELFYCKEKNSCKLSNRMYRSDEGFSFFSATMVLVPNSTKIKFQQNGFLPVSYGDNSDFPIYIQINAKSLKASDVIKGSVEKPLKIEASDEVKNSLKTIESFVRDIWDKEGKIQLSQKAEKVDKKEFYTNSLNAISDAFKKYWNEDQSNNFITNYQLLKSETSNKVSVSNTVHPHSSTNYTSYSLAQLLTNWKSYRPVAYLVADGVIYHWIEYEKNDGSIGVFLFSFSIKEQKLVLVTNSRPGRLLVNGLVAHKLSEFLQ